MRQVYRSLYAPAPGTHRIRRQTIARNIKSLSVFDGIKRVDDAAEALDAARIKGLEEAAEICTARGKSAEVDARRISAYSIAALGCDACAKEIRDRIKEAKR